MTATKPGQWMVTVSVSGSNHLGVDADWSDGKTLYIKAIWAGAVSDWNKENPTKAVQPGDRVISVNGVTGDAQAMVREIKDRNLLLLFQKASDDKMVTVSVSGSNSLGMDADWGDGKTLYIKAILAGAVSDWNKENPTKAVQPGDRVISVNGVTGDAQAMVREIKDRNLLLLFQKASDDKMVTVSVSGSNSLGMDADWGDGKTLYIKAILAGAVSDWNKENPTKAVQPGDRVISVNGVTGDAQAMAREIKDRNLLLLLFQKASDDKMEEPEPAPVPGVARAGMRLRHQTLSSDQAVAGTVSDGLQKRCRF